MLPTRAPHGHWKRPSNDGPIGPGITMGAGHTGIGIDGVRSRFAESVARMYTHVGH
jgi:hypothetical protein